MRAAFLRFLALVLALGGTVQAQAIQEWPRWDVFARLDNDGAVSVVETLVAHVNGRAEMLDRLFAPGPGQEVVLRKIVRVENGQDLEVADVRFSNNELFWRIKAENDPEWKDATLTFRLEYELRGAIQPAWDIPAGPGSFRWGETFPHFRERWRELWAAWREPAGRYRFDHDVLFARFSSEGPREFKYTFGYDDAWKHPQPGAALAARVTSGSDYRVTELRDYLRPGPPPAVAVWKSKVRVGSIAAFAVVALVLWFAFAVGEVRRRGWFGPRLTRAWFQENLAPLPAEILSRDAHTDHRVPGFPLLLARWRSRGVVEVYESAAARPDDDPVVHLRLLGNEAQLPAHERALLAKLFPQGGNISSTELQQKYAQEGFYPETMLDEALDEREAHSPTRARPDLTWFWKVGKRLVPLLLLGGFGLMVAEAFRSEYNDSIEAAFYLGLWLVPAVVIAWNLPLALGGVAVSLALLVPVLTAIPGMISLHFFHTLLLLPEGSVGLALMAIGSVAGTLLAARLKAEHLTPERRRAVWAEKFVRRELRRARPNLDDSWLPQIVALGCAPTVVKWRTRRAPDAGEVPFTVPSGESESHRPFTGSVPLLEERWAGALEVLSAEDRKDLAEEEEADGKDEGREGS